MGVLIQVASNWDGSKPIVLYLVVNFQEIDKTLWKIMVFNESIQKSTFMIGLPFINLMERPTPRPQ